MSKYYGGLLPLWLDVGYRLNRNVLIGAYFQYGFFFVSSSFCRPPLESCSGHDIRTGAQAHFHLRPEASVDPWLGAGLGYEVATLTANGSENSASRANGGFEFFHAEFGIDFPTDRFRFGPFISASFGEYRTESIQNPAGPSRMYEIPSTGTHAFILLGGRAQYDF